MLKRRNSACFSAGTKLSGLVLIPCSWTRTLFCSQQGHKSRGILRRLLVEVPTSLPDCVWLRWSDQNRCFHRGNWKGRRLLPCLGQIQFTPPTAHVLEPWNAKRASWSRRHHRLLTKGSQPDHQWQFMFSFQHTGCRSLSGGGPISHSVSSNETGSQTGFFERRRIILWKNKTKAGNSHWELGRHRLEEYPCIFPCMPSAWLANRWHKNHPPIDQIFRAAQERCRSIS